MSGAALERITQGRWRAGRRFGGIGAPRPLQDPALCWARYSSGPG
jgi:hypothetical protein